jgi:hypothetical protein
MLCSIRGGMWCGRTAGRRPNNLLQPRGFMYSVYTCLQAPQHLSHGDNASLCAPASCRCVVLCCAVLCLCLLLLLQCEAQVPPHPMSPRSAKRWEQLYGTDEVTAQKKRANALYAVSTAAQSGAPWYLPTSC